MIMLKRSGIILHNVSKPLKRDSTVLIYILLTVLVFSASVIFYIVTPSIISSTFLATSVEEAHSRGAIEGSCSYLPNKLVMDSFVGTVGSFCRISNSDLQKTSVHFKVIGGFFVILRRSRDSLAIRWTIDLTYSVNRVDYKVTITMDNKVDSSDTYTNLICPGSPLIDLEFDHINTPYVFKPYPNSTSFRLNYECWSNVTGFHSGSGEYNYISNSDDYPGKKLGVNTSGWVSPEYAHINREYARQYCDALDISLKEYECQRRTNRQVLDVMLSAFGTFATSQIIAKFVSLNYDNSKGFEVVHSNTDSFNE